MPVERRGAASSLLRSGVLDDDEVRGLAARGAVGDLVVHPFDADGALRRPGPGRAGDRHRRRRPAGRSRRVVAVASGTRKARAIRGALATGIVRMLVTDAATARAVLAEPA